MLIALVLRRTRNETSNVTTILTDMNLYQSNSVSVTNVLRRSGKSLIFLIYKLLTADITVSLAMKSAEAHACTTKKGQ